MIENLKEQILEAIKSHAKGHIKKHLANIEVYLQQPVGVGEHSDIIDTIEKEIEMVDKYESKINIIEKYLLRREKVLLKD